MILLLALVEYNIPSGQDHGMWEIGGKCLEENPMDGWVHVDDGITILQARHEVEIHDKGD